jgi:hypothetical protein
METLAQVMNAHGVPISASQVWRICNALDLKPWQVESWMTSHDPDFWEKAGDVCGLYLNPPENAVVWSVDEKSGMQAKSRVNPTLPAVPGIPARREFEYRRHGTAVLFAGLNVHEGDVAGWVTDSTRSENFVEFLADLVAQTPDGLDLHCIVDNLATHSTQLVEGFLDAHPHVHLHFTPTMSPHHFTFGAGALKSRRIRSGNGTAALSGRVRPLRRFLGRATRSWRVMLAATVL